MNANLPFTFPPLPELAAVHPFRAAWDFGVDACQRTVLFWDVLRRRGAQYREHNQAGCPPVLGFQYERIVDGMDLPRPTSYQLLRIIPPQGIEVDARKRPFIIIDPRAGQGPGIGGSQTDSQVGVVLRAGHPCYFVAFQPMPAPTQTIEDITSAEVYFLDTVRKRHPEAEGEPALIGNAQAGWAVTLLSGANPERVGPIVLVGTPLSYWDGVRGESPMRYFGGLTGGSWLGELASDLGNGRFDGAYLIQNYEGLNPGNALFKKPWQVYEKVDTEAERFLRFEKWWGGFFLLNAEEIRFITNELFIGNKLSRGGLRSVPGRVQPTEGSTLPNLRHRLDLRNIKSPIVVLTSRGDNIAPPPQALNWILDLYGSVEDIRSAEQTIVYCIHPQVGHLGIFVSGRLVNREHAEFIENIDLIELLPPGLYEAVITERSESETNNLDDRYEIKFVGRTLDDLRSSAGGRSETNTARFETVVRTSDIQAGLYRQLVQPFVRKFSFERGAEILRQVQPARLRYSLWTNKNPWFRLWSKPLEKSAEFCRKHRRPVEDDNPFWQAQKKWAEGCLKGLEAWRLYRDRCYETWFETIYGSPLLQAAVGLGNRFGPDAPSREYIFAHLAAERKKRHDELILRGGLPEAVLRGAMYVVMADHTITEFGYSAFNRVFFTLFTQGETTADLKAPPPSPKELRRMVHDQHALLLDRPQEAIEALPKLVGSSEGARIALRFIESIAEAAGPMEHRRKLRMEKVKTLLTAI